MELIKRFYFKRIALVVALGVLIIGSVPAESMAYVMGGEASVTSSRSADMAKAQRVLESKLVSSKLQEMGLSTDEVTSRLDKLSDAELHKFATQLDNHYPGGDGLGFVIALLIIVLLVLLILKITDRKIIVK